MAAWVVQRKTDGKYLTGLDTALWSAFVSGAYAYFSKEDAIGEVSDRGFRATAMQFLELPRPKARPKYRIIYGSKEDE